MTTMIIVGFLGCRNHWQIVAFPVRGPGTVIREILLLLSKYIFIVSKQTVQALVRIILLSFNKQSYECDIDNYD
jgi:hypothetical protein